VFFRKSKPHFDDESLFVFSEKKLIERAEALKGDYASAAPFPHAVIDDFLPTPVADRILDAFPAPDDEIWLDWRQRNRVHQPRKQGIGHIDRLDGRHLYLHHVLNSFNSSGMVRFVETLTGIEGLVPDPHFIGGGLHQILGGGRLAIHSDFNIHPTMKLYRRINLLLYLNQDWQESYGSGLELWATDMSRCEKVVAPIFNRCVIFNTDHDSFHGHPDPMTVPDGVTRKSLAFYYYAVEGRPDDLAKRGTGWQLRPGEVERED
jgi:hypothetical protein